MQRTPETLQVAFRKNAQRGLPRANFVVLVEDITCNSSRFATYATAPPTKTAVLFTSGQLPRSSFPANFRVADDSPADQTILGDSAERPIAYSLNLLRQALLAMAAFEGPVPAEAILSSA